MKKLKNRYILLIATFLVLLSTNVYAIPAPDNSFYVYDEANLLNNSTENYIVETNLELYEKTGAQLVWAIVNDLEGMDINTYATALFDEWDIGSKEYDNGLLVLIVPESGQVWIEVGYGLEGILPDSRVKRIIEENIIPNFSQGDFDAGVLSGYEEMLNYVESEYNIELQSRNGEYYSQANEAQNTSPVPRIFVIIGIIIFLFIDFKFFGGWLTFSLLRGLGRGGYNGGSGESRNSRGGGGRSGGGGAGGSW